MACADLTQAVQRAEDLTLLLHALVPGGHVRGVI